MVDLGREQLSAAGRDGQIHAFITTHRDKLLEADLLVLVGVSGLEGPGDLPHLVARQREAGLSEQLLQLKVANVAAVVDVCTERGDRQVPPDPDQGRRSRSAAGQTGSPGPPPVLS